MGKTVGFDFGGFFLSSRGTFRTPFHPPSPAQRPVYRRRRLPPAMSNNTDAGDPSPAVTSSSPSSNHHMTTTSRHYFGSSTENSDSSCITIVESMKEDYGLFVWPCSIVLAEYVWQQRLHFSGVSVVEVRKLGAGTSLPGLVAAKVGSDVTLTDDVNRPESHLQIAEKNDSSSYSLFVLSLQLSVDTPNGQIGYLMHLIVNEGSEGQLGCPISVLANMRRVSDLNNLNCNVMGLTWGLWDADIFSIHPKIILGADVLYDTSGRINFVSLVLLSL
ncbi:hypothetical protein RHGRI_022610 [Rhododendron griersonianum]|uniref:Methyltransferase family protein n=1 Tax=Rhododendron griersonianum TaxID=479676 RepID=A0AAV6J2A6_9ERIC|nr:hypothetical protein RHGRI_022610 [Rhododendron griersonianum]